MLYTQLKHEYKSGDSVCACAYKYDRTYKKNSTEPAWSKAVSISARSYAETKKDCVELFNRIIKENIKWHEEDQSALLEEDYE